MFAGILAEIKRLVLHTGTRRREARTRRNPNPKKEKNTEMKNIELNVCENPYEVKVHSNTLVTSGRRAEIARLILAGHSKSEIYKQLKEEFGIEDMAILQNEWRHAMTYIYLNVE